MRRRTECRYGFVSFDRKPGETVAWLGIAAVLVLSALIWQCSDEITDPEYVWKARAELTRGQALMLNVPWTSGAAVSCLSKAACLEPAHEVDVVASASDLSMFGPPEC